MRFLFFFVYFLVLSFRLFSLFPRFLVPSFSFFPRFVVPSLFIRKASRQQFVGFFPSIRLTLSPAMGRRPDYNIIFSVDINVTHVTRNSRLFAVTSTTCSTHTQSVSVPIHPIETDIYIHIANTRYEGYTYAVYSCVWRLWVVFLEHGGGVSWHFQVASLHLQSSVDLLFVRFTQFFLPEQASRAAYAARGGKRLVYTNHIYHNVLRIRNTYVIS